MKLFSRLKGTQSLPFLRTTSTYSSIKFSQRKHITSYSTYSQKSNETSSHKNTVFLLSFMTLPILYMITNSNESEVDKSLTKSTKKDQTEIIVGPSATIVQLSPELTQFYDELQKSLLPDQVDFSATEREARGKSWNSYHHVDRDPAVVVFPQSTEDVSKVLKLCFKYKVPGMIRMLKHITDTIIYTHFSCIFTLLLRS